MKHKVQTARLVKLVLASNSLLLHAKAARQL